uniref:Uncharacterized protein n=1 Tax=Pan troglodytes TaxID=9598 RepID=A0A2I3RTB1_PANTR
MGSLWGLALPLFFFCWEVGVSGSSAGPSTRRADTAMTTDDTEVPAMTPAPGHAALEAQTLSAETSSRASTPAGPIPEAETRGAKRISPARETRSFTKTSPNFLVLIATSVETSAASGSPEGAGMTTVQTITGSDPEEAIFDTVCTDDSSEEAKTLTMDILILAHTSTEAKGLSSEKSGASSDSPHPVITPSRASEKSGASSDGPHPVITPSRASESGASSDGPHPVITPSWSPGSDVTLLAEALVTVTHIEVINCTSLGLRHILIPTEGVKASSHYDPPALPDSTDAKPHITEATSATPDPQLDPTPTNKEVTAPRATTLSGALATGNPLEETSALSVETPSYVKVSGAARLHRGWVSSGRPQELHPSETLTTTSHPRGPSPQSRDLFLLSSRLQPTAAEGRTAPCQDHKPHPQTATPTTLPDRPTTDVSAGKWLLL